MSYVPQNNAVYLAAYAGALVGLGGGDGIQEAEDHSFAAKSADAFAQQIDTTWGANSIASTSLVHIQGLAVTAFLGRSPLSADLALHAGNYSGIATNVVSVVNAGVNQLTAQGIHDPLSYPPAYVPGTFYTYTAPVLTAVGSAGTNGIYPGLAGVFPVGSNVEMIARIYGTASGNTGAVTLTLQYYPNGEGGSPVTVGTAAVPIVPVGEGGGFYIEMSCLVEVGANGMTGDITGLVWGWTLQVTGGPAVTVPAGQFTVEIGQT